MNESDSIFLTQRSDQPASKTTSEIPNVDSIVVKAPVIPPATFSSWLLGVLNGGEDCWIMRYMESELFELARQQIKHRTGGIDVHMVLLACTALNAARIKVPVMLEMILDQVKTQATSSLIISAMEATLCTELLKIAREKSEESQSALAKFQGQREMQTIEGYRTNLPGNALSAFWHNGTHFTLEISKPSQAEGTTQPSRREFYMLSIPPENALTIRCFGHSKEPIAALVKYAQVRIHQSRRLDIINVQAGTPDKAGDRSKRPMSTVDLDPEMMADITKDVELFFHPDSCAWYDATGKPYRHGYLLHGPPGTGKTSLSVRSHPCPLLCPN